MMYTLFTRPPGRMLRLAWVLCAALLGVASLALALRPQPAAAGPNAGATVLGLGNSNTCAIRGDGTLVCWGDNSGGQSTPPPGTFIRVSSGKIHSCGIKMDDTLVCWGDNYSNMATPPPGAFTQVDLGDIFSCGLHTDGTLACWGGNGMVAPAGTFTQLDAAFFHACAIKSDGTLLCWGTDGAPSVPMAGTFTQVSTGYGHGCGIKSDGTLACWGDNAYGQSEPPSGAFTYVTAGAVHTCAMRANGDVVCWGDNYWNEVNGLPAGVFTQVSAGGWHTCGMLSNNALTCWGRNQNGESPYLSISPSLLFAAPGAAFNQNMFPGGGTPPHTFSLSSGSLPPGIVLSPEGNFGGTAPTAAAAYSFTLEIQDSSFPLGGTSRVDLIVDNPPVVAISVDHWSDEGVPLVFTATASDPDPDQTLSFEVWQGLPAGAAFTPDGHFSWTPADNGVYSMTITAYDNLGMWSQPQLQYITITNVIPVVDAMENLYPALNSHFLLDGAFSDPGLLDTHTVHIQWAPGVTQTLQLAAGVTSFSGDYTYTTQGDYLVTTTVIDKDGGTGSQVFIVQAGGRRIYLPTIQR